MDGISRSRGWDKEIPHGVLPMEQLVLSDKWARKPYSKFSFGEVYRWIYVRKSRFTASLARRRKTKFPTVYPTIYLPK